MVEIQRKWRWFLRFKYRWFVSENCFGNWVRSEGEAMFDYTLAHQQDLSKRVQDLEGAKANG